MVVCHPVEQVPSPTADRRTVASLWSGVAGLTLLMVVTTVDSLTRGDGYDLTRHWISLLQHGARGWLGTLVFALSGVLVLASVPGLRAVGSTMGGHGGSSTKTDRRDAAALPVLVAALGSALVVIAVVPIDPSMEYPVRTDTYVATTLGQVHSIAGAVVLGALAASCWVIAALARTRPGTARWVPTLARGTAAVMAAVFLLCSSAVVASDAGSWEAARAGAFQRVSLLLGGVWLAWWLVECARSTAEQR